MATPLDSLLNDMTMNNSKPSFDILTEIRKELDAIQALVKEAEEKEKQSALDAQQQVEKQKAAAAIELEKQQKELEKELQQTSTTSTTTNGGSPNVAKNKQYSASFIAPTRTSTSGTISKPNTPTPTPTTSSTTPTPSSPSVNQQTSPTSPSLNNPTTPGTFPKNLVRSASADKISQKAVANSPAIDNGRTKTISKSFIADMPSRGSSILGSGSLDLNPTTDDGERKSSVSNDKSTEVENVLVHFRVSDTSSITESVSSAQPPAMIRAAVIQAAKTRGIVPETTDPADFAIKVAGLEIYFTNDSLALRRNNFFQICRKSFMLPSMELVKKLANGQTGLSEAEMKESTVKELTILKDLPAMVGDSLMSVLRNNISEVEDCRKHFARQRVLDHKERTEQKRNSTLLTDNLLAEEHTLVYMHTEPMPISTPEKVLMFVHLPGGTTKIVEAKPDTPILQARQEIFRKWAAADKKGTEGKTAADYALKVRGFVDYLLGDRNKLIDFDYVRRCINKDLKMELSLVENTSIKTVAPESDLSIFDVMMSAAYEEAQPLDSTSQLTSTCEVPFKITLIGTDDLDYSKLQDKEPTFLYVMIQFFHGDQLLCDPVFSRAIPKSGVPRWDAGLQSKLKINSIPRAARMSITVFGSHDASTDTRPSSVGSKDVPLGWINATLFDHRGMLRTGFKMFKMWPEGPANPIAPSAENLAATKPATISIEFPYFGQPLHIPRTVVTTFEDKETNTPMSKRVGVLEILDALINRDPLSPLSVEERDVIWKNRLQLRKTRPDSLTKILLCVKWNDPQQVAEIYGMLESWPPFDPMRALELLDAKYPDPKVRSYAVSCLDQMTDGQCSTFLLQLTQVLKYEHYHDSSLANFLIRRAFKNPNRIGYDFFWYLKAEMHVPSIAERYGVLLEAYIRGCNSVHRNELSKQNLVLAALTTVANKVKITEDVQQMQTDLTALQLPKMFLLPLDPRIAVTGLVVSKCRFMDSKKKPLWLLFTNAEPGAADVLVLFKSGDDLRQDVLTLQMIRLMDKFWKEDGGLDFRLQPYKAVAMGDGVGMIEVVLNSETTAKINKEAGGALSVWSKDVLLKWLKQQNPSDQEFNRAADNFVLSTAGYCVATYVLGITDRHNDNIMMTRNGNLFHIDFGHFLGNVKKIAGIRRERAPFVFTAQYAEVMGGTKGDRFKKFTDFCGKAYNIVRKHSSLFIVLFEMMLSTGIPELQNEDDIIYLRDAFALDLNDGQAQKDFYDNIIEALNTKSQVIADMAHIMKHNK